jgi:hypothetical protein
MSRNFGRRDRDHGVDTTPFRVTLTSTHLQDVRMALSAGTGVVQQKRAKVFHSYNQDPLDPLYQTSLLTLISLLEPRVG